MGKTLLILEVSQKQAYIFGSKKLKQNAARSANIRCVTESEFFGKAAGTLYSETENLVYSGGGHTVLQFPDGETAVEFARCVTAQAMMQYPGLELFAKCMAYDDAKTPGENLTALSAALERKKSRRTAAFRTVSFGPEKAAEVPEYDRVELLPSPAGCRYPDSTEELAEKAGDACEWKDNFVAVIHIDGNAMGSRVADIYNKYQTDWESCCAGLRRFSEGIQQDFEAAFTETAEAFTETAEEMILADCMDGDMLPLRPVILAGDDMCFIAAGRLGLECARICLEHLAEKTNAEDGKPYAACAGVALVHTKYPFHQAYNLAEELCDSAKRRCAEMDPERRISAMDWHIEFGQLRDSLSLLREDYVTEDGNRMELRPVTVIVPDGLEVKDGVRSYAFFRSMCRAMQGEYGRIARSKIKELRTAIRQGREETEFFLHDREIRDLLSHVFESKYHDEDARWERYRTIIKSNTAEQNYAFEDCGDPGFMRCLLFDAIEMIDNWTDLKEVQNG